MAHSHYKKGLKKIKVSEPVVMESPEFIKSHFPISFSADSVQVPEIKHWEVGKKYMLVVEVEQKSKNEREDSVDASFEIVKYMVHHKKDINEMTDEEFGEYQGESLAKGELV